MANWKHRIKIRHFLTESEEHSDIQKAMKNIADELRKNPCFNLFNVKPFYKIPKGDDIITPSDYTHKLLDRMYDFADSNSIWID